MKEKSRIYIMRFNKKILLLGAIILFVSLIFFMKNPPTHNIFNHKYRQGQQTIVIDPGHGGIDGGTGQREGILEKDINLDVGLKLNRQLIVEGFDVIMTREKDESLEHLSNINSSRYRKDLNARKTIIDGNEPAVFISIHVNSSKSSKAKGIKVYHFPTSAEGKKLAEAICNSVDLYVYDKFLKDDSLKSEVLSEDYFVLRETEYTGVLVEIGFITNAEEYKLLQDEEYKEKVAYAIKKGILEYLDNL